jgi:hypothetical protein
MRVDYQGNIILPQSGVDSIQEKIQSGLGIPKAQEELQEADVIKLDNFNEKYFSGLEKGKTKVLSPSVSLENLNQQASES